MIDATRLTERWDIIEEFTGDDDAHVLMITQLRPTAHMPYSFGHAEPTRRGTVTACATREICVAKAQFTTFFEASLWLKGVLALAEIIAGIAACFVSKHLLLGVGDTRGICRRPA